MKKLVISAFILIVFCLTTSAQNEGHFGIKAGLNYNANGDYFNAIEENVQNPDRNLGYHIGVFGKIGDDIYIRPELVYTATKSDYDSNEFSMKKIDIPLLLGVKIIGPVSVFAGPSFQYIIDGEFGDIDVENIETDFSVGLNFGVALNFNKIGIDLRYERGFSDNEATFIGNNISNTAVNRIDTRPDQLILSLSIAL
jgi:hypothetical protein